MYLREGGCTSEREVVRLAQAEPSPFPTTRYVKYSGEPCALVSSLCCLVTDPHFAVFHVDAFRSLLGLETCWMWHMGGVRWAKPNEGAIAKLLWQAYQKEKPAGLLSSVSG